MSTWTFHDPAWFWALALLPVVAALRRWRRVTVLVVPFAGEWYRPSPMSGAPWPAGLAYIGLVLFIIGLARPQSLEQKHETKQQGYDIILAIDLSGSMLAEDYENRSGRINRLQAIKPVLEAFINKRPNDRIGIVVFAGRAYTFAPLTFDHAWLSKQTARIKIGAIEDGTAIGDGIGVALSRLEQGAKEKGLRRDGAFIVLLTDGANNAGALDPKQAASLAADRGVTIYTIGAGKRGIVPMPYFDDKGNRLGVRPMMSDLDEPLLRDIAEKTKGEFFRAEDSETIVGAFNAIDKARKIQFEAQSFRVNEELFYYFAAGGIVFLAVATLGIVVRNRQEAFA